MRIKSSMINITVGVGNQLVITALSFFSRTVFIGILGVEYLGINGLFTNILAMLSLAEAGIGSSIIYSLYKPVAENDKDKINVLMVLYKKAYRAIALVIFSLGIAVMPFLPYVVKDSHIPNLHFIYLLFLVNTVAPYFFSHKTNLLNVYQKGYIVTTTYSISSILSTCLKIGILYSTQNYILYLAMDSAITIGSSILLTVLVGKRYPFLKNRVTGKLDQETKSGIVKNIKAIVLQNIGVYLVTGTDNIIISSFVSVAAVGLVSNYNMLIDICRMFINQIFYNVYHSVGNLVAKESKDKIYSVYKVYWLVSFWMYSFFTIFLYIMIEPFIRLWLGPSFLMQNLVLAILLAMFYEKGLRNPISTVKTTAGIFHEDRYVPLCQAVINLGLAILLVRYIGIAGVFLGSLISALAFPFWTTPYFVYRKVFHKPVWKYFVRYFYFILVGSAACIATSLICGTVAPLNLFTLAVKGVICLIVPNIVYICIFYKTEEFRYLSAIVKAAAVNLQKRFYPARNPGFSSGNE